MGSTAWAGRLASLDGGLGQALCEGANFGGLWTVTPVPGTSVCVSCLSFTVTPGACGLCSHVTDGKAEAGCLCGPHAWLLDSPQGRGRGQGQGHPSRRPRQVKTSRRSSHPRPPLSLVSRSRLGKPLGLAPNPAWLLTPFEPRPLHTAGGPPPLFCLVNACGQVAAPGLDGPPGLLAYGVGSLATGVQANPLPGVPQFLASKLLVKDCPRLEASVCGLGSCSP